MTKNFVSTMRKGFHMTFPNKLTVSVQWGAGNYCDNHFPENNDFSFSQDAMSDTAEVAVWGEDGKFINPQKFLTYGIRSDESVAGYLTPSQVVDLLVNVRDWSHL